MVHVTRLDLRIKDFILSARRLKKKLENLNVKLTLKRVLICSEENYSKLLNDPFEKSLVFMYLQYLYA